MLSILHKWSHSIITATYKLVLLSSFFQMDNQSLKRWVLPNIIHPASAELGYPNFCLEWGWWGWFFSTLSLLIHRDIFSCWNTNMKTLPPSRQLIRGLCHPDGRHSFPVWSYLGKRHDVIKVSSSPPTMGKNEDGSRVLHTIPKTKLDAPPQHEAMAGGGIAILSLLLTKNEDQSYSLSWTFSQH